MVTINQLVKYGRARSKRKIFVLGANPQKKGVCVRVYTTKPKKPNSAVRKLAKVFFPSLKKHALVCIPGQGHGLSVHSVVLVRGGRVRDVPGLHCKMIRGKCDFVGEEVIVRTNRRSKYGVRAHKN